MLKGKTFILGVGAQRSGTTWLSYYLRNRLDVFISPIKELHFFDQKFRPDLCGNFNNRFAKQLATLLGEMDLSVNMMKKPRIKRLVDRLRMNDEDKAYIQFFADRLSNHECALGEITPSYSLIGKKGFYFAKSLLESEGLRVKVIFLMRDPVDRHYSALCKRERDTEGKFSAYRNFSKLLQEPSYHERTRYDWTCRNLLEVFDKKDIFFGFYEQLFTDISIERLCNVLDLSYKTANFDKIKNQAVRTKPLDDDLISLARNSFSPVYDYCRTAFGNMVPKNWR